jgi:hypothetical protein
MGDIAAHIVREELWSTVGFWVLVFGLAGDILVLVIPKSRERLEKILAACFIIVIIAGVAIEHRADASISVLVSEQQSANALQIAQLNKQAAEASRKAGEAVERAASAESQLAESNARAEVARKDAEAFRLDIAQSNERANKAEAEAAEAKLELEKFRASRTISSAAQERIIKSLEAFPGTPFDLSVGTDSESLDLMRTVQSVLVRSGWKQVAAEGPIGLSNSNPLIGITVSSGIVVEISAERLPDWLRATDTLVGLLKSEHFDVHGDAARKGVKPNAIHIMIGKKPIT